jgi:peptide/nickel transport system permease protein
MKTQKEINLIPGSRLLQTYLQEALISSRRLLKNTGATIGMVFILLFITVAIFAPKIAPHNPNLINPSVRLSPPNAVYRLGTDGFGRDVMSRLIFGARLSLQVSLTVALVTASAGSVLGLLAGYYSGVDYVLMRILDGFMAFPSIVFHIGIMAALGPSVNNVIGALAFSYIPRMARIVRSSVLVEKRQQYAEAVRGLGASDARIMFLHILPNCMAPMIIQVTMTFAYAILAEASLSFLGVGVPPEIPSWGNILSQGRQYIRRAPWIIYSSGIVISLAVLSVNMLGDGLRDLLDPKLRK